MFLGATAEKKNSMRDCFDVFRSQREKEELYAEYFERKQYDGLKSARQSGVANPAYAEIIVDARARK